MPFRTPLSVRHELDEEWRLLDPLVFEGREDFFVMRKDFKTDFASIPRPVRWSLPVKVGQVAGMSAVGLVSVGVTSAVAIIGRVFYWIVEWLVAVPWYLFERAKGTTTNLPWPKGKKRERLDAPPKEYLLIIPKEGPAGVALAGLLSPNNDAVVPDDALDTLPGEAVAAAY